MVIVEIIINTKCLNGNLCYNEDCLYIHPYGWNAFENKVQCIFCLKNDNSCNKRNKKYNHINKIKDVTNLNIEKINTLKKDYEIEFPKLLNINDIEKSINEDLEEGNIPKVNITINGKQISDFLIDKVDTTEGNVGK